MPHASISQSHVLFMLVLWIHLPFYSNQWEPPRNKYKRYVPWAEMSAKFVRGRLGCSWMLNELIKWFWPVYIYIYIFVSQLPSVPSRLHNHVSAWTSNHMPRKMWDEITYPFPNFNGCTVEVWEWISHFIPCIIMDMMITKPCCRPANHYTFCVITTHFECQIRHYASLSKMWENYAFYEISAPSAQYRVIYSNYLG